MSRHAAAGLACPTSLPQTGAEAAATATAASAAVAGGKQGKFVQAAYADKVSVSRGTAWGMWQAALRLPYPSMAGNNNECLPIANRLGKSRMRAVVTCRRLRHFAIAFACCRRLSPPFLGK